jgi:hypothetical protein
MDATSGPTLISPTLYVASTTPTYTWDFVRGATSYDLYTSVGGVETTVNFTAVAAGCDQENKACSVTPPTPQAGGASVVWLVRARNSAGTTPWGSSKTFKVMDSLASPTLIAPSGVIALTTPTYIWNFVAGATSYDIYTSVAGVDTTFTYTAIDAGCDQEISSCSITPVVPQNGGDNVTWLVRAKNIGGATIWSSSLNYQIQ